MKLHSTKHHRITSGQIWLEEHHLHLQHHCSAAQSVQHELQFVAPREGDLNVTPGNSFRSLPAHVRSSLSSPIPPPSLISAGLSPGNDVTRRQRQQQLNRSLFTSPLQNLVQKSHHHNCDRPEFLQDSKLDENQLGRRRRRRSLSPGHHHRQTSNNVIETSNTRSSSSMEVPGLARDMGNQHRGKLHLPGSVLNPSVLPNTSNWGNCTSGGRSTVVPVAGIGGGGGSAATGTTSFLLCLLLLPHSGHHSSEKKTWILEICQNMETKCGFYYFLPTCTLVPICVVVSHVHNFLM